MQWTTERHQNSGEIPYLYNVKIESVTPSPSIFAGEFHLYMSWRMRREHQLDLAASLTPYIIHRHGVRKLLEAYRDQRKQFLWAIGHLNKFSSVSSYLYGIKRPDPAPLYLYIVKIENFTRVLMPFLHKRLHDFLCFIFADGIAGWWEGKIQLGNLLFHDCLYLTKPIYLSRL